MIAKACAIVLHPDGAPARGLCFEHPSAGWQLVKGTMEPDEPPLRAARRELWEETGLLANSGAMLGSSPAIVEGEVWHFALLRVRPPVRDIWRHATMEDQGHSFTCQWHALTGPHPFERRFQRAWEWAKTALEA